MTKSFIHSQTPWKRYGLLCCTLSSLILGLQGSLNAGEITASPPLIGFNSNSNSPNLLSDSSVNAGWYFDNISLTGTSTLSIYFLQGATSGISSSTNLDLDFLTITSTVSPSISTGKAAWAYDTNNSDYASGTLGKVYYLQGSINGIDASPAQSLIFTDDGSNTKWSLTPTKVQGSDTAWYYDNQYDSSAPITNAQIYYLTGSITGITALSGSGGLPFQGGNPVLSLDSNPTGAWYYDNNVTQSGSSYPANVYYLDYSSYPPTNLLETLNFQQYRPGLQADNARNTAWYFDTVTSGSYVANIYYLSYDSITPSILVGSGSATFSNSFCNLKPDATPNEAWFFDLTPTSATPVFYLTGSTTSPSITMSSAKTLDFSTSTYVELKPDVTPHASWYYTGGDLSGNIGQVYYLTYDGNQINSSSALSIGFNTPNQELLTTSAGEAWYFDIDYFTGSSYVANAYYLNASTNTISSQLTQCTFNTQNFQYTQDYIPNAFWYYDTSTGSVPPLNGVVYYLSADGQGISSSNTTLPLLSSQGSLISTGPGSAWYFDTGSDGPAHNVYFLQSGPGQGGITTSGWTSGNGGVLSNSILNSSVAQARTLQTQMKRSQNLKIETTISQRIEEGNGIFLAEANDKYHTPIETPSNTEKPYLFQVVPFYDFINQKEQGYLPAFTNSIVGALGTFDAKLGKYVVGGGLAYAYNHAHLKEGLGQANINQEIGVVYGSWKGNLVYVDLSCWGGFYQMKGERDFKGHLTSRYSTQGYVLTPHAEIQLNAYTKNNWLSIDPFARADWINTWQKGYTEKSPTGFNLSVPHQHSSLLRTEAGLYVEETFGVRSGQVVLSQKASYINQLPFQNNVLSTLFVGGGSGFSIASGTMSIQNLGGVELQATFYPSSARLPIVGMDLQGEFGSNLQSYLVALELGKDF